MHEMVTLGLNASLQSYYRVSQSFKNPLIANIEILPQRIGIGIFESLRNSTTSNIFYKGKLIIHTLLEYKVIIIRKQDQKVLYVYIHFIVLC